MKYYTEDHEWVDVVGNEATIGISEHAASELGDITFVELPSEGDDYIIGDTVATVESVKAASDVYSPISGTVSVVNDDLNDDPGMINKSAESKGWICKMKDFDSTELDDMMNAEAYARYLRTLE
ncbi:MAG: glycine cleavage system protein GcvH [Victivallaceae bacterium]|jgi:glycine cleavage system H protein|nr:glycine cleavage system protein GcvH [Victivallaceae bacterium]NLK82518.1 glycine cleavage system protein GcvH [Lentisphaerota bacterium]MDD3116762.1 glycine cleavage system protein GcvH [Victivallaceae bacterium]MDD3704211.1 glycine cleavage system protein GcvH [Victivallaceae bacterium]MDD4316912.1 glycine cleavage system protein GcvH [Victivallaceae bacterium]